MRSFWLQYIIIFLYISSIIAGTAIYIGYYKREFKSGRSKWAIPKGHYTPNVFPVLIVSMDNQSNYTATVVAYDQIGAYFSKPGSHSYLVPQGKTIELKEFEVMDDRRNEDSYEVQTMSDGKQFIKATYRRMNADGSGSRIYSGWYITDGSQIFPKYLSEWNQNLDRIIFATAPIVFIIDTLIWLFGYILYRIYINFRVSQKDYSGFSGS